MKFSLPLILRNLLLTTCPPGAELSDITIDACPEDFGQIQKGIFQRLTSAGVANTIPVGSGAGGVELQATWVGLRDASDSTKAVQTPYIEQPENEPGEARRYGGGNATLNGTEIIVGTLPSKFTCMINRSKQLPIKQLKTYYNETGNLGVYLIDEYGRVGCIVDDPETPTVVSPIPIQAFWMGDKKFGGLENPDSNAMNWEMKPNWSDNFHIITPSDFNILTGFAA